MPSGYHKSLKERRMTLGISQRHGTNMMLLFLAVPPMIVT